MTPPPKPKRLADYFPPKASEHVSLPVVFSKEEKPTDRAGQSYIDRALLKWFRESSPDDQRELLRTAEAYAARNAK